MVTGGLVTGHVFFLVTSHESPLKNGIIKIRDKFHCLYLWGRTLNTAQVPCSVQKYHVFAVVRTPRAHSAGRQQNQEIPDIGFASIDPKHRFWNGSTFLFQCPMASDRPARSALSAVLHLMWSFTRLRSLDQIRGLENGVHAGASDFMPISYHTYKEKRIKIKS